jgi:predicted component of type VI protein secretion system
MALTNIELYEELKKTVTEDAARLIAEVVPKAEDLATKGDIERLAAATKGDIERLAAATKGDVAHLQAATREDFARLDARFDRLELSIRAEIEQLARSSSDKMLRYFVPLWVAVFGALGTMIALVVTR